MNQCRNRCEHPFRGAWRGSGLSGLSGYLNCFVFLLKERNRQDRPEGQINCSELPSPHTVKDLADLKK